MPSTESNENTNTALLQPRVNNKVSVLQTAKTFVITQSQKVYINVLFDSSSDRSYITADIAR